MSKMTVSPSIWGEGWLREMLHIYLTNIFKVDNILHNNKVQGVPETASRSYDTMLTEKLFAPVRASRNFTISGRGIGYSFQLAITVPLYTITGYCIATAQS